MAGQVNPYYNPAYADAAEGIGKALFIGDPAKAGEVEDRRGRAAYYGAETALDNSKTQRQQMENDAIAGMAKALSAAGVRPTPEAMAAAMPGMIANSVAAGVKEPGKIFAPFWAMQGEAQSGAAPAEAYTRAALIGDGHSPDKDFAPTPDRADAIENRDAAAKLAEALAVQSSKNEGDLAVQESKNNAPPKNKNGKSPVNYKTMQDLSLDALSNIPGATVRNISPKGGIGPLQISDDARDTLASSGALDRAEQAAGEALAASNGDENVAKAAYLNALRLPTGAKFQGGQPAKSGLPIVGWGSRPEVPASFVGTDGKPLDLAGLVKAVAPPAGASASSPDDPVIAGNPLPVDTNTAPRVFQPGPSLGPPALPAGANAGSVASTIPDPSQRMANQVYQTPKGPMTWTGTGWRP